MFRNTYQSGFLSILYSVGSSPLSIWDRHVENGHIKRISDEEVKSQVVEISGTNVATTYIFCPKEPRASLGVKLKFLVMIIKNLNKYFSFEITVLDNTNVRRRLRASNYQSTTRVRPFSCSMPMGLNPGWNQVQFNLADFTRRAYGTEYLETTRIQIHANCRIRRVYFADKLYTEDDVPAEYRLYVNDDPRTRRFSEPATAMTSAALTMAAMAGTGPFKPIDCSGAAAAPPTPCGGDILHDDFAIPVPEEKMRSFIGGQALTSTDRLPSLTAHASFFKEKAQSLSKSSGSQAPPSKPPSFTPTGFKTPSATVAGSASKVPSIIQGSTSPAMAGSKESRLFTAGSMPPGPSGSAEASLIPLTGSKPPSVMATGSLVPVLSPKQASYITSISNDAGGGQVSPLKMASLTEPTE